MQKHIFLAITWIIYSALHSFLATEIWKKKMHYLLNKNYIFYRSIYSLFALISLSLVLFYNFSLHSILLWMPNTFEKISSVIVMILSASIMMIFSSRFFFDLSGADVFKKKQVQREFINTNLYQYVRHPLYSATIVFVWSMFLLKPLLSYLITCSCITAYTLIGIIIEEKKLVNEFGENYISYRSKTPMLIPKFLNKPVN